MIGSTDLNYDKDEIQSLKYFMKLQKDQLTLRVALRM